MKVIIAGSRDITDYNILLKAIEAAKTNSPFLEITEVVCGEAKGVDSLGRLYAEKNNLKIKSFPADWNFHGKSAGYKRNEQMAEYGEYLLAVWDGVSKGTNHMIDIMRKKGKESYVFVEENKEEKQMAKTLTICSVDTETTGLFPFWNELITLSIIPLNSDFTVNTKIEPLNLKSRPEHPERWTDDAAKINGLKEESAHFPPKQEAIRQFIKWCDDNNIFIEPLAQNWGFDKEMIDAWLVDSNKKKQMRKFFARTYRDLKVAALFLDDLCRTYKGKSRFEKFNLKYLCEQFHITFEHHDANEDAIATATCYKKLLESTKKLMDVS